ncbi:MAG: maleylpyruvate isomerase N-terminal domain-containing protein [Ktedonobacterales bacterium]
MGNELTKDEMLALLKRGRAERQAFVAGLGDTERAAPGEPNSWSAKDHLAHMLFWQRVMIERLDYAARGEAPPDSEALDDFDARNAENFERERNRSLPDILSDFTSADAELTQRMQAFPLADLLDPHKYPDREGTPLWDGVLGNGFLHPQAHYAQYYLERGDVDHATEVYQAAARTAAKLFGDSPTYGSVLYNLACFYAVSGRREQALYTLREALPMNPGLLGWAKEDPDLTSLHDKPGFEALVNPQPEELAGQ